MKTSSQTSQELYDADALNIIVALGSYIAWFAGSGQVYSKGQSGNTKRELAKLGRTRVRMMKVYRKAMWPIESRPTAAEVTVPAFTVAPSDGGRSDVAA